MHCAYVLFVRECFVRFFSLSRVLAVCTCMCVIKSLNLHSPDLITHMFSAIIIFLSVLQHWGRHLKFISRLSFNSSCFQAPVRNTKTPLNRGYSGYTRFVSLAWESVYSLYPPEIRLNNERTVRSNNETGILHKLIVAKIISVYFSHVPALICKHTLACMQALAHMHMYVYGRKIFVCIILYIHPNYISPLALSFCIVTLSLSLSFD